MKDPRVKKIGPHYQCQRAFADGWMIEEVADMVRYEESQPAWREDYDYRIIPDAEGWLPWYAHEGAVCPVADGAKVRVKLLDGSTDEADAAVFEWGTRTLVPETRIALYRIVEQKEEMVPESDAELALKAANEFKDSDVCFPHVKALAREYLRLLEELKHCVPVERLPNIAPFGEHRGDYSYDLYRIKNCLEDLRKEYGRE